MRRLQVALELLGLGARSDVEPLDLLSIGPDEARLEGLAARCRERRNQRPVFVRNELLDFQLAVGDQPQCDRLHPAGRACARKLAPEHRREREPDEIVERTARPVGIDQSSVDRARMLHRIHDGLLGDGIEDDALDLLVLERMLLLQHLQDMPGDRLALAIGVSGEDQLVGTLDRPGDVGEALAGLGIDLPNHVEIVVRIDRSVLRRQVAHVTERGQDFVAGAQILVDRLRLCG